MRSLLSALSCTAARSSARTLGQNSVLVPLILAGSLASLNSTGYAQSIDLSAIAAGLSPGFAINGQTSSDQSGYSVSSAGDVNGDGLSDLLVGAWYSDPAAGGPGNNRAGRSYVVFGKSIGNGVDLSAVDAGLGGFVINGEAAGDRAGARVSTAGDVNGDGLTDVIVGAFRADPVAGPDAGRSYVVFGKTNGTAVELSEVASGTTSFGFVINGQDSGENSGFSVSTAGDVNGDGLSDVIVGAPLSTPTAGPYAGRVYVVFGKTSSAEVDLSEVANGSSGLGFAIDGRAEGDRAGISACSAGDVNGDGLMDLVLGADRSGMDIGRSFVVFGKTSSSQVALSAVATGISTLGFVLIGEASGDDSGWSVSSAGDVNGDGLADVIVGARDGDPASLGYENNAGRSYVVFASLVAQQSTSWISPRAARHWALSLTGKRSMTSPAAVSRQRGTLTATGWLMWLSVPRTAIPPASTMQGAVMWSLARLVAHPWISPQSRRALHHWALS